MAAGQSVVLGRWGPADRVEDAVDATADDGVGGLEAAVVIGVAAQAGVPAHLVGEREVQQARDSGEEDDAAVACGGQAHAGQEGLDRKGARAATRARGPRTATAAAPWGASRTSWVRSGMISGESRAQPRVRASRVR